MNKIKIDIFRVKQGFFTLYVGKIKASKLIELSFSDIRRVEEGNDLNFVSRNIKGIQRKLKVDKIKAIKDYLSSFDATFPNGVIMNINSEYIIEDNEDNNYIILNDTPSVFNIIDGQHRLAGLHNTDISNDFDVIITFYKDLDYSQQANIFSVINSQQTKVDPSLKYSLELDSIIYTPRKFISLIAMIFFENKKSPWYDLIKIGIESEDESDNSGLLSFAGFCRELESILYKEKDLYKIRNLLHSGDGQISNKLKSISYENEKFILWKYYLNDDIEHVFGLLLKFFKSFERVFTKDWRNPKSILNKTTGYGAMIKLFLYIMNDLENKNQYENNEHVFDCYIDKLAEFDGKINSAEYSASGGSSAGKLFKVFKEKIFD